MTRTREKRKKRRETDLALILCVDPRRGTRDKTSFVYLKESVWFYGDLYTSPPPIIYTIHTNASSSYLFIFRDSSSKVSVIPG